MSEDDLYCVFPIAKKSAIAPISNQEAGFWTQSVKLTFLVIVTCYLTKSKTKLNNLYHSSHIFALSKGTIFAKKKLIFVGKKI